MAFDFLRKRTVQQKRIFILGFCIAISLFLFTLVQVLSVARVMLQDKRLGEIRETMNSLKLSYKKIDNAINIINSAKTSDDLDQKVIKF